ncbi:MAG: sulfatase, partial [Planctomycetota bacterium]
MSTFKLLIAVSLLLLIMLVWWQAGSRETGSHGDARPELPNIIVITVDTLRADHLGCYGYSRDTSPHLDRFAAEGMLFKNCYSQASLTTPSCASILSGFLPHETEMMENSSFLSEDVPMIAERLEQAGYRTCAVVSNWVLNHRRGLNQGFRLYDDQMDESEANRNQPERTALHTTDRCIELLKDADRAPLFLWVHYQDPHGSYTPPPPFDTAFEADSASPKLLFNEDLSGLHGIPRYQRLGDHDDYGFYVSRYDGEIRYFDEQFGRLVEGLKSAGLYEDSLILFTADHGEAMGEHDYYFSHGHNLDHCLLHVPLVVHGLRITPGVRDEPVQHLDIVPTILDVIGARAEDQYRGRSLLEAPKTPSVIYSQRRKNLCSLMVNGLKLVKGQQYAVLYDVINDPDEKSDLISHNQYKD